MEHRSIDGSLVSLTDPSGDYVAGFTAFQNVLVGGIDIYLELVSSDKTGAHSIFHEVHNPDKSRTVDLGKGRRLTVGEKSVEEDDWVYNTEIVMIEGDNHGLTSWQPGGTDFSLSDFITSLEMEEEEGGFVVKEGRAWRWDGDPSIAKGGAKSGSLLEILPLTRDMARALPKWSGAPVRGGELFLNEQRRIPETELASDTAVKQRGIESAPIGIEQADAVDPDDPRREAVPIGLTLIAERAVGKAMFPPKSSEHALRDVMSNLEIDWRA